ncbi:MAG TPA: hypothetical protein EYP25_09980 [Anaerolineae bacterium]|nr:hypothetical protein [Anaerolineae bacterium]
MFRTILAILGVSFVLVTSAVIFLGKTPANTTPLNVNLDEIKPPQWQAYYRDDGLVQINIDHDAEPEWLFFYKDGYNADRVGAVIYDAQNRPRNDFSIPIASQAPAYLIPYRLLPDYTPSKNLGYLSDSDIEFRTAGSQSILTPTPTPAATPAPQTQAMSGAKLLVKGKIHDGVINHFAIFWWMSPEFGYNGALATTPGWFSLSSSDPQDWKAWKDDPDKITQVWAWEPQVDRSNICRVAAWTLEGDGKDPATWHFSAHYDESQLRFCTREIPSEPAFPEGQVLAFLLDQKRNRWRESASVQTFDNVRVLHISEPVITDQPPEQPRSFVDVDFNARDGLHSMRWTVEMIPPATVKAPVRWRILRAEERTVP